MKPSNWNWTEPAVQFWGYNSIEVSNDANGGESKEIPGWGVSAYFSGKELQQIQMEIRIIILQ